MKIQDITNIPADPEEARAWRAFPKAAEQVKEKEELREADSPSEAGSGHPKELARLAEAIRKYIQDNRTSVNISVDADLQQVVIRVLSSETGEVIRQYPEDAVLDVMKHLKELRGLLLNKKG